MFLTEWICILTSGHTVDGREVEPQTLVEMAETYDPEKYCARINIEHNVYGPTLGSVLNLKVEDSGEDKKLFAKLKPNDYLLYFIQQGQKLHNSCEIIANFAKTGKAYLIGLAVTDNPASLGTTEMHLSANNSATQFFSTSEPLEFEGPKKQSLLNNLLSIKPDESIMDKATLELLTQLQQAQSKTTESLKEVVIQLTNLSAKPAETEPVVPETKPEDSPDQVTLLALAEQVKLLSSSLEESQKSFTDLTEKLSNQTDEQHRYQATGGNNELEEVY